MIECDGNGQHVYSLGYWVIWKQSLEHDRMTMRESEMYSLESNARTKY